MRKVLVDTNLMLLLVVGLTDRQYIAKHKRLQAYEPGDFDAVFAFVSGFAGLVSCPNIWTETSNLVRHIGEPMRSKVASTLKVLVHSPSHVEVFTESRVATSQSEYLRLGITDSVLLTMTESNCELLTDDLPVYLAAIRAGHTAFNYNHMREARLRT